MSLVAYACGPAAGDLVDITSAKLDEETQSIQLVLGICSQDVAVVVDSTETEVIVRAGLTKGISFWDADNACVSGAGLVLDAPLGDRRLIDAYDGQQLLPDL